MDRALSDISPSRVERGERGLFKRLSEVWAEDYAAALEESEDEEYALSAANDRFVIPEGAHWKGVRAAAKSGPTTSAPPSPGKDVRAAAKHVGTCPAEDLQEPACEPSVDALLESFPSPNLPLTFRVPPLLGVVPASAHL